VKVNTRKPVEEKKRDHDDFIVVSGPAPTGLQAGRGMTGRKGKGKKGKSGGISLPPAIATTPVNRGTYRYFVQSAVSSTNINANMIGQALGGICTVANSKVTPWTSAFRIKSVTIYPSSASGTAIVELKWAINLTAFEKDYDVEGSLPGGITNTHGVRFVPPKGCLGSFWINNGGGGTNVFAITAPVGSLIDLDVEFTMCNNLAQFADSTIVSGTLATIYYLSLDSPGNNKLQVMGRPTTA
jgi:hypothetical protein